MSQSTRRPTCWLPIVDPLEDRALPSHGGLPFGPDAPANPPPDVLFHRGPGPGDGQPLDRGPRSMSFDPGPRGHPGEPWGMRGPGGPPPAPAPFHAGSPGRDAAVEVVFEATGGGGRGRGPEPNAGPNSGGGSISAMGQPTGNGGMTTRADGNANAGMPGRDRDGAPAEPPAPLAAPVPGAAISEHGTAPTPVAAQADPADDAPAAPVAGRPTVAIAGPSTQKVATRLDPALGVPHPHAPGAGSSRVDDPAEPEPLAPGTSSPAAVRAGEPPAAVEVVAEIQDEPGALPTVGADLITGLLPFDRGSLEQALARFLQGLEEEPAPPVESATPGARPLAFVAAVLGLEAARRWRARRRWVVAPVWLPGRSGEANALS